jgi:two-component system, chemotaxis family, sensor kinase CheA
VLIMRAVAAVGPVTGSEPAAFGDDFDGSFFIFLGAGADLPSIEHAIRAAGDVDSVDVAGTGLSTHIPAAMPEVRSRQLRVDAGRVDRIAEAVAELSVLASAVESRPDIAPALADSIDRMATVLAGLQHDVLALRMVPVRETFEVLPRVVRDAARTLGREVDLAIAGEEVELDRLILDEIREPLTHLLRNAVGHGIETPDAREAAGKPRRGHIMLAAERERSSVRITVTDDGGGVDAARVASKAKAAGLIGQDAQVEDDVELFRLISNPGLSTADEVSAVAGRGVGMDVVVSRLRALGGAIQMATRAGAGTTFTIRLPLTLAVAQALRVRVGAENYAVPLTHVAEAVELDDVIVERAGAEMLRIRGRLVPLVRLRQILRVEGDSGETAAVITEFGGRRMALAVDELIGREQILVRTFDAAAGMLPYFSGATVLADGRPALVLDPLSVL